MSILLLDSALHAPAPGPVPLPQPQPQPLPGVCWDREVFITDGFSDVDINGITIEYGVYRDIIAAVWHDMQGYLAGAIQTWNLGGAGADLCVLRSGEVVLVRGKVNGVLRAPFEVAMYGAGTSSNPNSGTYGRTPFWRSHNINPHAVHVELEGFATTGYTAEQARACRRISDYFANVLGIRRAHTFDTIPGYHAHSELSAMRGDPGPLFDWAWVL